MSHTKTTVHQLKSALVAFLMFFSYMLMFYLLMLMLINPAHARERDYLKVNRIDDANFGTWRQSGSLSLQILSCIASANDDDNDPRSIRAQKEPYQIKVENRLSNDNNFLLYLDGDVNNTGNRRIAIQVSHQDILSGSTYESLIHDNYDNHFHTGQYRDCDDGDNSQLKIDISASELSGKVSGTYTGMFRLTALGGSSGNRTDREDFWVTIDIQASSEVQISGLDDLSLGTHSGSGNINAQESFCIYSSAFNGNYSIEISSTNQDSNGNFYLDGASLGKIPYNLVFIDSGIQGGGTTVGNSSLSGSGNTVSQDCGGSNNATLSLSINETALQAAESGNYQDTLILLVQPQ